MEGEGEGEARLWCCSALHSLSRSPQLKSKLLGCGVLQRGLLPILLKAADELGDWAEVKIRQTRNKSLNRKVADELGDWAEVKTLENPYSKPQAPSPKICTVDRR